jgi:tripartite-type tricarboxylate transporter receptor subunit TctC
VIGMNLAIIGPTINIYQLPIEGWSGTGLGAAVPGIRNSLITVLRTFLGIFAVLCTFSALAQAYPTRPITLVVPAAAGGNLDISARVYAQAMGERLNQAMVVDNRTGASSTIGFEYVARSSPDGYTLLWAGPELTVNQYLYKLDFAPKAAFAPIAVAVDTPVYLVVRKDLPVSTVAELIALAKARPRELTYASAGLGTPPNLAAELFKALSGTDLLHVPYKGAAQGLNDLLAGRIDVMFPSKPLARGFIGQGRVKLLATTGSRRLPSDPSVPTAGETVPGFSVLSWAGVLAPAGSPKPVIDRLSGATHAALSDKKVSGKLEAMGLEVVNSRSEEMAKFMTAEIDKWGTLVKSGQIKPEQ